MQPMGDKKASVTYGGTKLPFTVGATLSQVRETLQVTGGWLVDTNGNAVATLPDERIPDALEYRLMVLEAGACLFFPFFLPVLRLCLSSQNSVSPYPILCVSGAIWPPRRFHPRQIRISPSFGPSWTYGPTDGRHITQYSDSVRIDGRLRGALLFFRRARF